MNHRMHALLEIYRNSHSMNLAEQIEDMKMQLEVLTTLTDSLHTAKVQVESYEEYLEVLLMKFSLHSFSIIQLYSGTQFWFERKAFKYTDISSIYTLSRAQLENYLIFYYLYIKPRSKEEAILYYHVYQLSGLQIRQGFGIKNRTLVEKFKREASQAAELKSAIQSNAHYRSLNKQEQHIILKKFSAKLNGWEKLIEESKLNSRMFKILYKLYSNYSHSEMISCIQLKGFFKDPQEMEGTLHATARQTSMLIAMLISDLRGKFSVCEIMFNSFSSVERDKVEVYCNLAKSASIS